ncbi:hypothetical protein B0J14DRAFT_231154 [Halenospora varia]|nr:hypothetical protein B0J14DRAFT_231154 [Halenospora varia]
MFFSNSFIVAFIIPLVAGTGLPKLPILSRASKTPVVGAETFDKITPSKDLKWIACGTTGTQCAVLDVPLDYDHPKDGPRAQVPMIKYPATAKPYKGMVMFNPGGPGSSAVQGLQGLASQLIPIIGENYDLVAWEPRGLGLSKPNTNCSLAVLQASTPSSQFIRRFEKIVGPDVGNSTLEQNYAASQLQGQVCQKATGGANQAGPHMSTGVVVRDMLNILDLYAKSPEAKDVKDAASLNYWGFSYGTIIGQTFAMMAPDRVGRVVLDGVVDPDDHYTGYGLTSLRDMDAAFSTFFTYCHLAGPQACKFYEGNTAYDIYLRFEKILDRLDTKTSAEQGWANATLIELAQGGLRTVGFKAAYNPTESFPQLSQMLVKFEQVVENITEAGLAELTAASGLAGGDGVGAEWLSAVSCTDADGSKFNKSLEDLSPITNAFFQQSYIGATGESGNLIGCSGWSIKGIGRYGGPFGGPTKNPILFASSTRDPVTPLARYIPFCHVTHPEANKLQLSKRCQDLQRCSMPRRRRHRTHHSSSRQRLR